MSASAPRRSTASAPGPRRSLLVPVGYIVIGLGWFFGATLVIPAIIGEVGPNELTEALADLALFLVGVALAALYEVRYRAAVRRALADHAAGEQRFRAMLEASPAAIVVVDEAGQIVQVNGRVEPILGYRPDEIVGRPVEILVPAASAEMETDLRDVFRRQPDEEGFGIRRHLAARRKDGSTFAAEIAITPLEFDDGPRVMVTAVDVSERQRIADERVRQAASFRRLFASNPIAMWVFDPETLAFLEVNDAAVAKYGYSREEFLAMRITDIRPPEEVDRLVADVAAPGPPLRPTGEWRHRLKNGQLIDVEIDAHDLVFDDRPVRLVAVRDITERKRAFDALRESEARFRQIAESIRECFWLRDVGSGTLIYLSPAYEEIWGRPRPEPLPSTPLSEAIHPDDHQSVAEAADDTSAVWERPLEFRIVRPDESIRWIRSRRFPVADASGAVRRIAGVAEDITDEKVLAVRIQQVEKMEAIGQLAGGVVHDFTNMLTSIRGFAELIHDASPAGDARAADAEEIITAVDRAADLTRKLLAFSRQQVLELRSVDLDDLIPRLQAFLQQLVGESVVLEVVRAPDLGLVHADPIQVEQILLNLAANARDAMPDGGRLTIEMGNVELDAAYASRHPGLAPGRFVSVSVSDTGVGMDSITAARAFEPFFTTKEPGRGTGLGLATVYGIAKQSGGHVEIYSEPGRGTTVWLYLPRTDTPPNPEANAAPEPDAVTGSETILLVEDDSAIRAFAERALTDLGYGVLPAANGKEAIALASRTDATIDLLVTDVVMPEMSGHELANRLLEVRPGMRVLYVSGYAENSVIRQGVLAPGVAFVSKPFTIATLGRRVRKALQATSSAELLPDG